MKNSLSVSPSVIRRAIENFFARHGLISCMDKTWSIADYADFLKIHVRTLRRWRRRGLVPPPDIERGNFVRWFPDTVKRWQESAVAK